MENFAHHTVVITGAAGGIGKATAAAFYKRGANLVLSDLTTDHLLPEDNRVIHFPCDVTDMKSVEQLMTASIDRYGRLDIAINNAGIASQKKPLAETDEAEWHRIIAVNLTGVFYAMKAQIKIMMGQSSGHILNVASLAGIRGAPQLAAYGASKHGVIGLTKSVVHEIAPFNIRANALCPGYIRTTMLDDIAGDSNVDELGENPMNRYGTAEEMAKALLWMASDGNSFMNGQAVVLDGGYSSV